MSDQQMNELGTGPITGIEVTPEAPQGEAPSEAPSASEAPQPVPYDRFKEVNDQKNQYMQQAQAFEGQVNQLTEAVTALQGQMNTQQGYEPMPNIESVDDLLAYQKAEMKKMVESQASEFKKNYIEPMQQSQQAAAYSSQVSAYFSNNPEAAQLKDKMDDYTKDLSPDHKQFIINSVSRGDTKALDQIFHTVSGMNRQDMANLANQQQQSQQGAALNPTAYKAIRSPAPTQQDNVRKGSQTGDFSDFFSGLAQAIT